MLSPGHALAPRRRSPLRRGSVWFLAGPLLAAACVRAPLAGNCPRLDPGALVVSELRGAQDGSYRQWVELYNASADPITVQGLRLAFTRLDGTKPVAFVVRAEGLEVASGQYIVLGGGDPEDEPYIDYDYTPDYHSATNVSQPRDLYGAARLQVSACGVLIDELTYHDLPTAGTLALDGATPPDALRNDGADAWCIDERDLGPNTEIGLRGSPGEANPPCP